jgi:hypothetical protein
MSMMMTIRIFHGVTKTGNKLGSIRTASIRLLFTRRGFLEGRDVLRVSRGGVSWSGVSWGFVIVAMVVLPVVLTISGVGIIPLDLISSNIIVILITAGKRN